MVCSSPSFDSLAPCLGLSLTRFPFLFASSCRVDKRTRAELCAHHVDCAAGSGSLAGAFFSLAGGFVPFFLPSYPSFSLIPATAALTFATLFCQLRCCICGRTSSEST